MELSVPSKLRKLNKDDREFIDQNLLGMRNLLANIIGPKATITPENLDIAYSAWLQGRDPNDDPESGIFLFAFAFCQCVVDQTGMVWKIAEGDDGIEPVIHKEAGNVLIYPISLVAKRFHRGETEFFASLFPVLCQQAGFQPPTSSGAQAPSVATQATSNEPKRKPFWKFW